MLTGHFVPGPDTSRAQVKAYSNPIHIKSRRLDIGHPGAPCMLFGMAYSITEAQRFSADITFDSQF